DCITGDDGTCTAGTNKADEPDLSPGTYYWVQTDAPQGYETPDESDQPVGKATITSHVAGTDIVPEEVVVQRADVSADSPQDPKTASGDSDAHKNGQGSGSSSSGVGGDETSGSDDGEKQDDTDIGGSPGAPQLESTPDKPAHTPAPQGLLNPVPNMFVTLSNGDISIGNIEARVANLAGGNGCRRYADRAGQG